MPDLLELINNGTEQAQSLPEAAKSVKVNGRPISYPTLWRAATIGDKGTGVKLETCKLFGKLVTTKEACDRYNHRITVGSDKNNSAQRSNRPRRRRVTKSA